MFEHARLTTPRREHGYCTDDVARAVVVLLREPERTEELDRLLYTCVAFVGDAQLPDGRFRNRLSVEGRWLDEPISDDTQGRALVALAATAAHAPTARARHDALSRFRSAAPPFRSSWPRSNALAALAAATVVGRDPSPPEAAVLLERSVAGLGLIGTHAVWPWPEPRLAYANAVLAEARIAAGVALDDPKLLEDGLVLLDWLVGIESRGGHFSFTPVGGWAPGEPRPSFDQQPIEAGAMADACARAFEVTGDPRWQTEVVRAASWFLGKNDVGATLVDPVSAGCCDGLEADGCNENQGAESTLAMIAAFQAAQAAARSALTTSPPTTVAAPTHRSAAPYVR